MIPTVIRENTREKFARLAKEPTTSALMRTRIRRMPVFVTVPSIVISPVGSPRDCPRYRSYRFPNAGFDVRNGFAMAVTSAGSLISPSMESLRLHALPADVPPPAAEVLGSRELLAPEDRAVVAHELVVERARVADPDPAFHVPLEGRLHPDPLRVGGVDDLLHHDLGPA